MLRIPRRIKSFSGVQRGEVASVQISGGPTLHEIALETNILPQHILRASLILNGDTIIEMTGEQMKMLERYKKQYEQAGMFILPIADISGRSLEGQAETALVTFPTDNITLEVAIAPEPDPQNPLVSPSLRADALVSAASDERVIIPRVRTVTFSPDSTGENIMNTLPRGPELRRMHLRNSDGGSPAECGIDFLRILRDRLTVYELSAHRNEFELKRRERAPQDLYFHFDPIASGFNRMDKFRTASDELEFKLDMNNTNVVQILLETVERAAQPSAGAA